MNAFLNQWRPCDFFFIFILCFCPVCSFPVPHGFRSFKPFLFSQHVARSRHLPLERASSTAVGLQGEATYDGFLANATETESLLEALDMNVTDVPGVKKILAFAIPAIGVYLLSPMLSMIDTSAIGLFAGTAHQAALNPATAVTDYSARTMSFLYTGTTNMISSAQANDERNNGKTEKTFLGALRLSFFVGATLASVLSIFATNLLRALIGNDGIDPEVFSAATKYVRIRALGMPAAAIIGTSQAACLGMQDVKSPLRVILVAGLVNLAMDLVLVGRKSAWLGGAAGAAWATIMSQYVGMALYLHWLGTRPVEESFKSRKRTYTISPFASLQRGRRNTPSFPTRGFLANRVGLKSLLKRPDKDTVDGFKPYWVPVTTTQVGRCSTYIAMGHVVSSSFGTASMAANQIITSIFYTLIPIADSLSLTAQTFIPRILNKSKTRREKASTMKTLTFNLLKVAGIFGIFLATVVACIPLLTHLFTSDPFVMDLVAKIIPILFIVFSLHGVFCGSEGILLAQRDLTFLGRMYAVYFAVVPALFLQIKRASQLGVDVGLRSVWNLFLYYQLFRISVWVGRVAWLQHKADRAVEP